MNGCDKIFYKKTFNYPEQGFNTFLTGIRRYECCDFYVTGSIRPDVGNTEGVIYRGNLRDSRLEDWVRLNYPGSKDTTFYGPDPIKDDLFQAVGSYNTEEEPSPQAFLFEGVFKGLGGTWKNIAPPNSKSSIAHSVNKGFVVGNYVDADDVSKAFLYNIALETFTDIVFEGVEQLTAYSILNYCDHHHYYIAGGAVFEGKLYGYIGKFNSKKNKFGKLNLYSFDDDSLNATHFNGISEHDCKLYLTGDYVRDDEVHAFYLKIDGCDLQWRQVSFDNLTVTSGNSIYRELVIGVYKLDDNINGYLMDME